MKRPNFIEAVPDLAIASRSKCDLAVSKTKELTYEIVGKCDLSCKHCSAKAEKERTDLVSFEEFVENIEKYDEFWTIRLSWWEPFHHPKIVEMVDFLVEKGKQVEILSSWVVDNKPISHYTIWKLVWKIKIIFSYHWYFDDHHAIVDPKVKFWHAFWDDLMDSVEQCAINNIPFSFQTVILQENVWKIEEIVRDISQLNRLYAAKIEKWKLPKIQAHFLRFVKQWRWLENDLVPVSSETIWVLPVEFENLSRRYNVDITYSSNIEMDRCDCGNKKMVITADKDIISCSALKWDKNIENWAFACKSRL